MLKNRKRFETNHRSNGIFYIDSSRYNVIGLFHGRGNLYISVTYVQYRDGNSLNFHRNGFLVEPFFISKNKMNGQSVTKIN